MNVLGLACSPRVGGNTDLLLDEFLRGARDAGATTEKIHVAALHIEPCTQCDACSSGNGCSIDDDMQQLYPRLADADGIALATPIYFMAHCAQAKLVIDRCQKFWLEKHGPGRSTENAKPPQDGDASRDDLLTRRGIFIAVGATHGPKVFAGAKTTMRWLFHTLGVHYWGDLLFEALDTAGAVRQHPTALQDAYETGVRFGHP